MRLCNNCNRVYKMRLQCCPACNSTNFTELENQNNIVLKYDEYLSLSTILKEASIKNINIMRIMVFPLILFPFLATILFSGIFDEKTLSISNITFMESLMPAAIIMMFIFVYYFLINIIFKIKKTKSNKLSKLSRIGVLIKNLNYEIVPYKNKKDKYQIKISYIDEQGNVKELFSDIRKGAIEELKNLPETADILIDPNDNKNYYIGFEIY